MEKMEKYNINESISIVNNAELIGSLDKILKKKSIAVRVSDVQPTLHPLSMIVGADFSVDDDKLKINKQEGSVNTKRIRSVFTDEALQNLESTYKESFHDILALYLSDELTYRIDKEFMDLVKDRAKVVSDMSFDDSYDKDLFAVGQAIAIKVNKGLSDLPISDNRSPNGWAVVSSNIASILSLTTNLKEGIDDDSPSYLGRLSGVDYYIDYTHDNSAENSVVFGIKGNGLTKGSTIFSPYTHTWIETTDSSSGEPVAFLMSRNATFINPLDEKYYDNGNGESGFLGKINIDVSDLTVMKD